MANLRKRRSSNLLDETVRILETLDVAGRTLRVGLSGGIDSVVLLKALLGLQKRFPFELVAVHVNHGLSPHAMQWEAFCIALCKRWTVPLTVERVSVKKSGRGLEAEARAQRYRAFAARPADYLVLAHHLDDQAETMLLQLLRGAGVRGLTAMQAVSTRGRYKIPVVRPLLAVARADIERFARRHRLQWITDESNDDNTLRRNFLRNRVLPEIESVYPAYRQALARSAGHFSEAADLLEDIGRSDAGFDEGISRLDCARLRRLPAARAANALRVFLATNGLLAPDTVVLREMLRQLLTAKVDAGVRLMHDGVELRRYRDAVWILRPLPKNTNGGVIWNGEPVLHLGAGAGVLRFRRRAAGKTRAMEKSAGIDATRLATGTVSVRWRTGGEKMRPDAARPRRSLKHLLQDAALPPWDRETLPLLYCGESLVWVPGIGVDSAFSAVAGEPFWFVSWQPLHYTRANNN